MKFKVFLINLDASKDRFEYCLSKLKQFDIDFERFSAVDGKELSSDEIEDFYSFEQNKALYKKTMSNGEVACYLSHFKLWKQIVDEDLDYAIILEDDFELNPYFSQVHQALAQLKDWDYIRLANPTRKIKITERIAIDKTFELVRFNKTPINTLAQAVSNKGAKQLLLNFKKIARPIDVDLKHCWEKEIDVIGINPPIVLSQNRFESDISKMSQRSGRERKSNTYQNIKFVINFNFYNLLNTYKIKSISHYLKNSSHQNK